MGVSVACLWRLLLLALLVTPSVGHIRSWGPRGHVSAHSQRGSHAGKAYSVAQNETTAFSHALGDGVTAGMVTYFWLTSGPTDFLGRYVTDNLIVRYYIDDEPEASLVFTPAMMAGSGVGLEHLTCRTTGSTPATPPAPTAAPPLQTTASAVKTSMMAGRGRSAGWARAAPRPPGSPTYACRSV